MSKDHLRLGQKGEILAVSFLKKNGYRILVTNFRVKQGEVDIIARHHGELVFVEVKTRSGTAFGHPAEAVTKQKQQQLIRAAMVYLSQNNLFDEPARFDVVSVIGADQSKPRIEVIQNAFELHG